MSEVAASPAVDGIRVEHENHVAVVWLDRPERGNAFTTAMQEQLHHQLNRLDAREDVRAIIVTGSGRLFSGGADMEPGGNTFAFDDEQHRQARTAMGARPRPWQMRTPIIGALNGSAVGLGLTLPLQWDIRIVNESAKYGFVFTRRGLIPEQNSLWLLPKLVGLGTAVELLLTGRLFLGKEAVRLGVATEAVPAELVLSRAREVANDIVEYAAPSAIGVTKTLIYEMLCETDRESAFYREWANFRFVGRQPDASEGVQSFLQKRQPAFLGSKHLGLADFGQGWDCV